MDRSDVPSMATEVGVILDRARVLSREELVRLAAAYRGVDRAARGRTLEVAIARAAAKAPARRVAANAAAAVREAAGADAWRLCRLDVLWNAQMAVADAAIAALVGERLSADVAGDLSAPWRSVA